MTAVQFANVRYHSHLAGHYHEQPFFSLENRRRVRTLLEDFRRRSGGRRLLDVGCGTGFIFEMAHDLFDSLEGIDITPDMLARIEPRPNVRATVGAAEAIPFADGAFNVVTCYGLLHHLEDFGRFFREARRVLKPGGTFFADEFPSQQFRDALAGTDYDALSSELLRAEWSKVVQDAQRYTAYGIEIEETEAAMVQCYRAGGLREESLNAALREAGFESSEIRYRWFLGEGTVRRESGAAAADAIDGYLRLLLPLSRPLFKYMTLSAR